MINIEIACKSTELVKKTKAILRERGADQTGRVILAMEAGIGAEGFRIEEAGPATVRIIGNDECGLLYGAGKFLRDPAWRGTSVPEKPIRAIYFASHFHNFYHDAPIEKVERYIEDLALWGCNTLTVWFDMHHYTGIKDPAAQKMIVRLRAMLRAAESVGMRPGLMLLANESYSTSPEELRADWTSGHDGYFAEPWGHYHVEICPNQPGGLELILRWREEMLDAFQDVNFGFVVIWPYDQGGCTCSRCAPWGANGFLTVAEPLARRLRQRYPAAKIVMSTWYFDHFIKGEWEGLSRVFSTKPDWVDFVMADDCGGFPEYPLKHGLPGGLPALNFPEISMVGMGPWGGFGANPRLAHWQDYWNSVGDRLAGGFPYSEGIFEDINKVLQLQLNWNSRRTTREIAREYAASEFAPDVADEVVTVMLALEESLNHGLDSATVLKVLKTGGWDKVKGEPPSIYWLPKVVTPEHSANTLRRVDSRLPKAARQAWRWRILFLRALLDEALHRSGGRPTRLSDDYFEELVQISCAENAEMIVSPVSRRQLTRLESQLPVPPVPAEPPRLSRWHSPFVTQWQVSALQSKTVAGAPVKRLSEALGWQTVTAAGSPAGFINVHPLVADADGLVYLGNKFRVKRTGHWILHVGHDGGVRVFVNGRAVLTVPDRENPAPLYRSKVSLALEKGTHEIVIAFDTAKGMGWGIFVSFEVAKSEQKAKARPVFPSLVKAPKAMLAP